MTMDARATCCYHKTILHESVESANNLNDLIPILESISLNKIKDFANQQIDEFDATLSNKAYFNSMSIDRIMPDDIIQHTLSFHDSFPIKNVNKKWKQISDKNERIFLKKIKDSFNESESSLKYDKMINNEWNIYPHPNNVSVISQTIEKCKSGDKILIHGGTYYEHNGWIIDKNIQLIGVDDDVIILKRDEFDIFCVIESDHVFLENITIEFAENDAVTSVIDIHSKCMLSIKGCKFKLGNTGNPIIEIFGGSYLNVTDCEFNGAGIGIIISPIAAEINVIGNNFKNCGIEDDWTNSAEKACILLYDGYREVSRRTNIDEFVRLKCIGNIFENNECYPIAERHGPYHVKDKYIIGTDRYISHHNILRGYNLTKTKVEANDANKLYYNDEAEKAQ